MTNPLSLTDPTLSTRAIASWETNAAHWDATITAHGNVYWRRLQAPCLARLLSPTLSRPGGCRALDLATGNGLCARWLLAHGATEVVATDASEGMLSVARGHCEGMEGVRFRRVDVTDEGEVGRLVAEEGRFGVVLMNMAVMDVAEVEMLARGLKGLLEEGGVFVATLLHPAFFTSGASRNVELRDNAATGDLDIIRSITVRDYMSVPPALGWAVPGQPAKQIYFHRPMHELFATFFKVGMVMDAMEELAFTKEDAEARLESTRNFTQLPVILAFRMRFV
ncbi:ribosomal protein L11 methyltransferase [Staphylotrichum tortipilum]|uniref:Ribosomal protein L11 methyltransferase n=1 Tax=Staphylotrichum tortipilum TaxID=2831512 RepID=A0AAN6RQ38_9PEZI|nr:ribosomal protein L11 methyltransferase [Staphylotrichum longicolle]